MIVGTVPSHMCLSINNLARRGMANNQIMNVKAMYIHHNCNKEGADFLGNLSYIYD